MASQIPAEAEAVLAKLKNFNPVVVGTYPLNLNTDNSDIDILCESVDLKAESPIIKEALNEFAPDVTKKDLNSKPSIIYRFKLNSIKYEIVFQKMPTTKQRAYLHMVAEQKLLEIGGEPARLAILKLKNQGIPTEPAFGMHFKLKGNPYDELLKIADLEINKIKEIIDFA